MILFGMRSPKKVLFCVCLCVRGLVGSCFHFLSEVWGISCFSVSGQGARDFFYLFFVQSGALGMLLGISFWV